jgi:hypothetical protein
MENDQVFLEQSGVFFMSAADGFNLIPNIGTLVTGDSSKDSNPP